MESPEKAARTETEDEQGGADQSATAPEAKPEGGSESQSQSMLRPQ